MDRPCFVDIIPGAGLPGFGFSSGVSYRYIAVLVIVFVVRKRFGNVIMAVQPIGTRLDIVITSESDLARILIQLVQVMKSPLLSRVNRLVIGVGSHMFYVLTNIRGPKLFPRVEVN
jgi:hypothetical protein